MKNVISEKIKIDGQPWLDALQAAYSKKQPTVKLDGFRKGKVPYDKFIKAYGIESLYMDAVDIVLETEYGNVVDKHINNIAAKPRVDIAEINEDYVTLEFTIITKPEVKLGAYTKLKVKKEAANVTDEEVETEVSNIIKKYADQVEKTEGSVENGDIAVIDFEGFHNNQPFEGGKSDNYSLEIGSNTFIPGFEEQIIGMKLNEEKDIHVTFPENYHSDDLKGQPVVFKIKLNAIKTKQYPEFNEDFFKDLNMPDVKSKEELYENIKQGILRSKEANADNKFIDDILEAAATNAKVEIHEAMISDEVERMISEFKQRLAMQQLDYNMYLQMTGADEATIKEQMAPEAEKRVKYRVVLEAIKESEKIAVTAEDISQETKDLATKYNMPEEEFVKLFGGEEMVKFDLEMRKTLEFLKNNN